MTTTHDPGSAPPAAPKRATIADFSMCGYLYYGEELTVPLESYINVMNWLDRIRVLPGWKHPYDMMPGKPSDRA